MIAAMIAGNALGFEELRGPGNAVRARGRLVLPDGTAVQWRTRRHRVVDAMAELPLRAPVTLTGWLHVSAGFRNGQPYALIQLDAEQVMTLDSRVSEAPQCEQAPNPQPNAPSGSCALLASPGPTA